MIKMMVSMLFCILAVVFFVVSANVSRHELTIGMVDVYGDTSGIRQLSVSGRVGSWVGLYGYYFHISPQETSTQMQVFHNSQTYTAWAHPLQDWHRPWHPSFFETVYLPLPPYELVLTASEWAVTINADGTHVPMIENRIYADKIAVKTRFHGFLVTSDARQSIVDDDNHTLFIDLGEGGHLFSHRVDSGVTGHLHHGRYFTPRFGDGSTLSNFWRTPLVNSLVFDALHVYVLTGAGLFGEIAVYGISLDAGRVIPLTYRSSDSENIVLADVLIPITLTHSEDEILGLLQTDDGFLLFISRKDGLAITRFFLETGETETVQIPAQLQLRDIYTDANHLIFHGYRMEENRWQEVVWSLTLLDDGVTVTNPATFALGGPDFALEGNFLTIHDSAKRDGFIFFVYTIETSPFHAPLANTRTYISAFNVYGELIGRVQVLNGVEEDTFWVFEGNSMRKPFDRHISAVSLTR